MKTFVVVVMLTLVACSSPVQATPKVLSTPVVNNTLLPTVTSTIEPTKIPTLIPTETLVPTTTPTITPSASTTSTKTLVPTTMPTAYDTGRINCPGSVALMYHHILNSPKENPDLFGIDSDIFSFEKVLTYLVNTGYYFPTPAEFSEDIKDLVCIHKYAIVIIDDSWNDPQKMGVTKVLTSLREENSPGSAKVWFGVITGMMAPFTTEAGDKINQWVHLREMENLDLVYPVSHSQTHPAALVDIVDVYSSANDGVYAKIAGEVRASRQDFLINMHSEPWFFIYPGGNVNGTVSSRLFKNGYSGAFTVTPGGLDKSYPGYLPRINAGYGCDKAVVNNAECVIGKIKIYSGK